MRPDEQQAVVGWHLIARGGDMTAKVHASMQLGVLASGDLSFEPPDALMAFDPTEEELKLRVLADAFELEVPGQPRCRELSVSPQTHVVLDFLGHTLDLDNDFARPRPVGEVLEVHLLRLGEQRPALGPLSAAPHGDEIVLAESGVDYVQREHALARSERQSNELDREGLRPELRVPLIAAVAMVLILGVIGLSAMLGSQQALETADESTAVAPPITAPQLPATDGAGASRVSPDVMERFAALVTADPLPDKASLDFAIESLKSLRLAYPGDPSVTAALERLTERLVSEAKLAYDGGDAFAAGRLIEQASSTGVSQVLVAGTLDAFSNRAPGTGTTGMPAVEDASTVAGAASVEADPMSALPEVAVADSEAAQTAEATDVGAAPVAGPEEPAAELKLTAGDINEPAAGTSETAADTTAPAAEIEETAAEIEETGAEIEETAAANSSGNEASAAAVATLAGAAAVAASVENESVSAGASGPDLVARDAGTAAAATAPTAPPEAAAERSETARAPDTVATAESATISAADAPGDADALAASAESDVLAAEDSAGGELDALVTSATGLALGALSVELIVNSESAALPDAPAAPAGNLVVSNPSLEPAYAAESLEGRVRDAMAPLLDEPAAPSADSLPDGFADEDALAFDARPASYDVSNDLEAMAAGAAASSGPRFYPFSELTTTFQEPLTYPRRTIDAGDGFVDVEFSVNERGRVDDLVVLGDPPPVFARSASRTLRRWRFEPVLINGEPVTVRTGLRITYRNPF